MNPFKGMSGHPHGKTSDTDRFMENTGPSASSSKHGTSNPMVPGSTVSGEVSTSNPFKPKMSGHYKGM